MRTFCCVRTDNGRRDKATGTKLGEFFCGNKRQERNSTELVFEALFSSALSSSKVMLAMYSEYSQARAWCIVAEKQMCNPRLYFPAVQQSSGYNGMNDPVNHLKLASITEAADTIMSSSNQYQALQTVKGILYCDRSTSLTEIYQPDLRRCHYLHRSCRGCAVDQKHTSTTRTCLPMSLSRPALFMMGQSERHTIQPSYL